MGARESVVRSAPLRKSSRCPATFRPRADLGFVSLGFEGDGNVAGTTVAEERSFTRAAKHLNISTSGLSHAIRRLEEQIGVRLLTRTTRSLSPTDAGDQLLAHLRPSLADIRGTLTTLSGLQTKASCPAVVPETRGENGTRAKAGVFVRDYPDVVLDITTDDSRMDPVAAGFDAAIHFGEFIAQDMVAVRVSPDIRHAIVGALVLRVTCAADVPPRPVESSVHQLPPSWGEHLQVGAR
jgi:DNA-binding transcriptional LysR family regulator